MTHQETCLCAKRQLVFRSEFAGDTVTKIYCPECVDRAPDDAIIFDLCEPGEFAGTWGVQYNVAELKRLDPAFRPADDYFLSLLISGTCGPEAARSFKKHGLCRIFGFKKGPAAGETGSALNGSDAIVAAEEKPSKRPGDRASGPREPAGRRKK
jgi:hypothetical protein